MKISFRHKTAASRKPSLTYFLSPGFGLAIAGMMTHSAQAASAVWNVDSDGSWGTASNWNPATDPGAISGTTSTDTATFGPVISAARAITVDTDRNISGIDFAGNSSAYALSGGNLIITNGGLIQTSLGGSAHTDVVGSPLALTGNATFGTNSSTVGRILSITGAVTGSATGTSALSLAGAGLCKNPKRRLHGTALFCLPTFTTTRIPLFIGHSSNPPLDRLNLLS